MSDLDLLLHMQSYDHQNPATRIALQLAQRLQARLDGMYIIDLPVAAFSLPEAVPMHLEEVRRRDENAEAHAQRWHEALVAYGLQGRWRVAQGERVPLLCQAAAGYSWLIVERSQQYSEAPVGFGTASRCVFGCGRPVLVVPDSAEAKSVATRIVVAWNGSRESTLALIAALPLLRQAEAVLVLDGGEDDMVSGTAPKYVAESATGLPPPGLHDWLSRHGVVADVQRFEAGPSGAAGPGLIEASQRFAADLVVMGAWGRSRFSELVLGGTTRHMFLQSRLPMLVAR